MCLYKLYANCNLIINRLFQIENLYNGRTVMANVNNAL